jgi:hypothetical protein
MMRHHFLELILTPFLLLGLPAEAENAWVHVRGSWEPPAGALGALKNGLQSFVAINTGRRTLRPWQEYAFQYQGQVDRGRRYILVNALCRVDPGWSLQSQVLLVLDGGTCYFHLKYDPVEGSFYDLFINAER